MLAQGAPSNADLLRVWQRIALPASPASRRGSRLHRLFTSRSRGGGDGGGLLSRQPSSSMRLATWLGGSRAGRSLSWLLRLQPAAEGHAAADEEEEEEEGSRRVMEIGGDAVDLDGLTLVLSAANAAAGGQLEPAEVAAAARAIMHRWALGGAALRPGSRGRLLLHPMRAPAPPLHERLSFFPRPDPQVWRLAVRGPAAAGAARAAGAVRPLPQPPPARTAQRGCE